MCDILIFWLLYKSIWVLLSLRFYYSDKNSILQRRCHGLSSWPIKHFPDFKGDEGAVVIGGFEAPPPLHVLTLFFLIVLPCLIFSKLHCAVPFCGLYLHLWSQKLQKWESCNYVCLPYIYIGSHTSPSLCCKTTKAFLIAIPSTILMKVIT